MTEAAASKRDFLVSFNRADQTWATWIAWVLEEAGYTVWFQDWDFRGNFVEYTNRAHALADRTLAVLSDHYLGSDLTLAEWSARFAQDPSAREDRLVPVKVGPLTGDDILGPLVFTDLTNCPEEEARRRLLSRVKRATDPTYRNKPRDRVDFPNARPREMPTKPKSPFVQSNSVQRTDQRNFLLSAEDASIQRRRGEQHIVQGGTQSLSAHQLDQLIELLVSSFDEKELDELVRVTLGRGLFTDYAHPGQPFPIVVFQLLTRTVQEGSTVRLIAGVLKRRPSRLDIRDAVARILPEAFEAPPSKQVAGVVEGLEALKRAEAERQRKEREATKPAPKIFISYRRDDSAGHAGRVHDKLERKFGRARLFMDVDTIPLGRNFVKVISEKVAQCDVLLAVIGPNWLTIRDEGGNRRLDNPNDFVRVEIGAALKRDIHVIPVLLDGAKIPKSAQLPKELKELALRNSIDIRHASFGADMNKLIKSLTSAQFNVEAQEEPRRKRKAKRRAEEGT